LSISSEEVERIARLASLAVDEASIPELTRQISDILKYVAQLDDLEPDDASVAFRPGPASAPLRADVTAPIPMTLSPQEMAPDFERGLYIVPRVGGLGDDT
jgi:aspartyl-tRNA(Asn)/glutamyl-tRNA(Gln) amidotransferase subunit C